MTMTRPPETPRAGSQTSAGGSQQDRPGSGLRIAGFSIRLTAGAYLLAMLAVLVSALTLPTLAPGWPTFAYLVATAALVTGLLGSLVTHELSHAIIARRYGATTDEIRIGFFGSRQHSRGEFTTPRALARAASAGPAASFALTAISAGAALGLAGLGAGRLAVTVLVALAWLNGLLTVVSVLPAPGMDGGQVVHALAWARSRDRARGAITAARVGQFTGALLIAGGVTLLALGYLDGIWAGLIGLLMVSTSRAQAREVLTVTALSGMRVRDILPGDAPAVVPGWQSVQSFLDGGLTDGTAPAGDAAPGSGTTSLGGASTATAFPVRDFDGRLAALVTLTQIAGVPANRRDSLRLSDVATPLSDVVTATLDEPLNALVARLAVRPSTPAALHTAGHALVLGSDGETLGVLTPADFERASQLGMAHTGRRTR